MTPSRRNTLAFRACAAVLVAFVVALQVIRTPEPLGLDQGLLACFARGVPRGALPYRDLFDGRPPLLLYWWAASAIVPGDVIRAAWGWEGLWLAGTLGVAYAFGRRLGDRWVGLAAAALLFIGLWSPAWGDHGQPFGSRAQAEEILALPMIGSAWLAWRGIDRARLALPAGVLVGVCGLFEMPSMIIALAWMVGWLTTCSGRDALRRVALMALGALAPWALALGWFARHGATGEFVEAVFVYPRYAATFAAAPWDGVLQQYATTMLSQAPLLLVAAGIGVFRLGRRKAREVHWAAAWVVTTMVAVVAQRPPVGHSYILAIPALAVVGALGIVETTRVLADKDSRALAGAALGGLALFAIDQGAGWWKAYSADVACLTGRLSRHDYLVRIQPGAFSMADEEESAASVRAMTAPADGLLIWGQSPGLYALAERHPVTRYPLHKIVLTDAPLSRAWPGLDRRRAAFMERLRADPPALLLVGQNDPNALEPMDSYASLGRFRELRAFVQGGYEPAPGVGRWLVFRRRSSQP